MSKPISKPSLPLHTEQVLNHEYDKSNRSALKNVILTRKKEKKKEVHTTKDKSTEKENQKRSGCNTDCGLQFY